MSPAPVKFAPITRIGAPLAKARSTPCVPTLTPKSALPEITACTVSPAPAVPKFSSVMLYFLKMPAFCPRIGACPLQISSWPIATLKASCADAGDTAAAIAPASRSDKSRRCMTLPLFSAVVPAKAGSHIPESCRLWVPAFAGTTSRQSDGPKQALLLARRDLDELGELLLAQRRIDEFELDGVALDAVDVLHLVGLHRRLRMKFLDRVGDHALVELHLLGIELDRLGIGVHPVDRLAVALDETHDRVALVLKRVGVDDDGAHRLPAQRRHVAAADEDADLALLELLHAERRRGPADVDLAGHDLGHRPGRAPGRRRLGLDAELVGEGENEVVRARAAGGIGDRVAGGDVLDRLERRIRLHVPIEIAGSGEGRQQDVHRRAARESAHDAGDANAGAEIGAAGDDGLHGLARALGADIVQHQVMLLEDAGVLAERRRLVLPVVDLADRDLELILRERRSEREQRNQREHARPRHNMHRYHCRFSAAQRRPRLSTLQQRSMASADRARRRRTRATLRHCGPFVRATNAPAAGSAPALPLSLPPDWCRSLPARREPRAAA